MRQLVVVLLLMTGAGLAAMLYQQVIVEGSLGPSALVAVCVLGIIFVSLLATFLLSRTRYKDVVAKVWLGALSAFVAYLAMDVVAGWILIQPLSPPLMPDEYRHHKLVPNSQAEFRQRDFAYVQRVNNMGMRGRDITIAKPPGTYRIVMLGDSFTMGKGVEDDQTSSVILERSLRRKLTACNGRRLEVLNAGVDSYAPVLSLIQLRRDLTQLQPDMVILNLDVSDLSQETAYRSVAVYGDNGEVVAVPQRTRGKSAYEKLRDWTGRHLFFTRALLYYANRSLDHRDLTVRAVVMEADPEITAHTLEGDSIDRRKQWNDIFDSIERMNAYSKQHGMEFLLTVYPWAHQISETEWIPGRYMFIPEGARPSDKSRNTVRELAEANGIEFLDLFPSFRSYVGEDPLYFDHDMHFTLAGQEVFALGIEIYLQERHMNSLCGRT